MKELDTSVMTFTSVTTFEQLAQSNWSSIVYVDSHLSVCRQTTGVYQRTCDEYKDPTSRITYRCILCHREDVDKEYCKATTDSGRRCAGTPNSAKGYCFRHPASRYE
jgi:hypothetical protein